MTIQVIGSLLDPVGKGIDSATIRITSLENVTTLPLVEASVVTGSNGEYDFNLIDGKYSIEVLQTDTYNKAAYVETTVDTTSPIELKALIEGYAFCEVEAPTCEV